MKKHFPFDFCIFTPKYRGKLFALVTFAFLLFTFEFASAQIPSYVPTNGLVGYWPFNGNANDESGNGNNGMVYGATLTMDRFGNTGKACYFDGVNDFITISHSNSLAIVGDITMSVWKKSFGNTGNYETFLTKRDANGNWNYSFGASHYFGPGGCSGEVDKYVTARRNGGGAQYELRYSDSIVSTSVNLWTHMVVVIKNNEVRFYINGQITAYSCFGNQFTISPIDIGAPLSIGSCNCGLAEYFNGILDDIAIYNRALTQEEITALYTGIPPCAATSSTTNLTVPSTSLPYTWNGLTFNTAGSQTAHLTNACGADSAATLNLTVTNTLPSYLPANGLVAWYPFNGNANDESGNGNNGTVNGATLTTDRFGNAGRAYNFSNAPNYIDLPEISPTLGAIGYSATYSMWFNGSSDLTTTSTGQILTSWTYPCCDYQIRFEVANLYNDIDKARTKVYYRAPGENNEPYSNQPYTLGFWHNIIVVVDAASGKYNYYFDGQIMQDMSFNFNTSINYFPPNRKWQIGALYPSPPTSPRPHQFIGKIDDIAIYNRALTQEEITALYRNCTTADSSSFSASGCNQYNLPWGDTVTTSGSYTHTYTNASGCDSIVTSNITIHHPEVGASQNVSGANFYVLPWSDTVRTSGYYTHTYQNQYGCDSLVTYYVVINQPSSSNNPNVGININNPQRSLHVKDIIRLEPRNTPPENPTKGDMYFDGTLNKMRYYDGVRWVDL